MAKFWSKEWVDTGIQKANSDKDYLWKASRYNAKAWVVITDHPDGNDISVKYTYDNGKVTDVIYEKAPAPSMFRIGNSPWNESISLFRTQAPYDTWAKIQKGETSVTASMNAKQYVTEGDMMKVLQSLSFITAFNDILATVPCEY